MIGIRCNLNALQYKRLSSLMSRVADSPPEKQGSKSTPSIFIFFVFKWVHFYGSITPPIYCIMTVKECMAWNNFSGPGTIILKVNFLCINSTRKPLLIHGFSPINAWLLTVYGTAFYAIISNNSRMDNEDFSPFHALFVNTGTFVTKGFVL